MSASFLSSVSIFLVGGIISLIKYVRGSPITGAPVLDATVAAIIFANAAFFLYLELYAETDEQEIARLKHVHGFQWILRAVNQTNLALMWLWLDYGLFYCVGSLIVFYLFIFAWDAIVFRTPAYKAALPQQNGSLNIVFHDAIGFGAMLAVLAFVYFFKVGNPGFIAHDSLAHGDGLDRLMLLTLVFFVIIVVFGVNTYVVIKKIPVDLIGLMSRDRRV